MRKLFTTTLAAILGAVAAVGPAVAAVPAEASDMFTTAATDWATVQGLGFTLMTTVVGGLIVFKLVKKVANKAT